MGEETVPVGVIGGSGLYEIPELERQRSVSVSTPFGEPSDDIVLGEIGGRNVAFLPRHGTAHTIQPTELNSRANIYALKELGVRRIVSVGAVGSLRESIRPRDLAVPDQIIDRTRHRADTFFGQGLVAHVGMAEPYCSRIRARLLGEGEGVEGTIHDGGTYLCIEGPQFSTRAESQLYREWGADYIGMTVVPEAKLAREAEICYGSLALVSDYDAWHEGAEEGDAQKILEHLQIATQRGKSLLASVLPEVDLETTCVCEQALEAGLITPPEAVPAEKRDQLELLVGTYWDG